jgi:hypothetical protein
VASASRPAAVMEGGEARVFELRVRVLEERLDQLGIRVERQRLRGTESIGRAGRQGHPLIGGERLVLRRVDAQVAGVRAERLDLLFPLGVERLVGRRLLLRRDRHGELIEIGHLAVVERLDVLELDVAGAGGAGDRLDRRLGRLVVEDLLERVAARLVSGQALRREVEHRSRGRSRCGWRSRRRIRHRAPARCAQGGIDRHGEHVAEVLLLLLVVADDLQLGELGGLLRAHRLGLDVPAVRARRHRLEHRAAGHQTIEDGLHRPRADPRQARQLLHRERPVDASENEALVAIQLQRGPG